MNNNFYYKGKYFEDENDFWNYVKLWPKTFVSEESLTEMLDVLKSNIIINTQKGHNITNSDMEYILEKTFFEAMKLRTDLKGCQEKE